MSERVLVIDPQGGDYASQLAEAGFAVTATNSDREGLERLKADPQTRLILTNLEIPAIDAIRRIRQDVLILAMTANLDSKTTAEGVEHGVTHFLPRPFETPVVVRLVTAMLRRRPEAELSALSKRYDEMLDSMQKPGAGERMQAAFNASPEQLGDAAVAAARRRG